MPMYTTSRGRTYEFDFRCQTDGSIRIDIVRQPSYSSRDSGCHATHRLNADSGRPYICWDTKLTSVQDAAKVAAGWAARTDVYIDTGVWKK